MKAIVYTQYGPSTVLQLKEVEKPEPMDHQVLVKVHAASVNALDYRPLKKIAPPDSITEEQSRKAVDKMLGADVAGTVEAVGRQVSAFKPGDAVFGTASGSFAEYVCNGESKFALKPAHLSFEAAAAVPVAAFTALQGLRDKGKIRAGQKVLIDGAGGGVGTFAVQIARAFGAEVTAVCGAHNLEMARSIGAAHAIDYTQEDFTRSGQRYDLILAVNGYHPMPDYQRALNPHGICVVAGGTIAQVVQSILVGPLMSMLGNRKVFFMGIATTPAEDLAVIKEMLEAGQIVPVIDRCYPLAETAEAIQYVMQGHARGKVVITVNHHGRS